MQHCRESSDRAWIGHRKTGRQPDVVMGCFKAEVQKARAANAEVVNGTRRQFFLSLDLRCLTGVWKVRQSVWACHYCTHTYLLTVTFIIVCFDCSWKCQSPEMLKRWCLSVNCCSTDVSTSLKPIRRRRATLPECKLQLTMQSRSVILIIIIMTLITREHWIQCITFAAETIAADTHSMTAWRRASQYLRSLSGGEGNNKYWYSVYGAVILT